MTATVGDRLPAFFTLAAPTQTLDACRPWDDAVEAMVPEGAGDRAAAGAGNGNGDGAG